MQVLELTDRTRKRLVRLLAEDRVDGERLLRRLREVRALDGVPTCAATLQILTHLCLPEDQAEGMIEELLHHRDAIGAHLGRDPGLRVAALDYLQNVQGLLCNAAIVEATELETIERSALTDPLTRLYNRRYFDGRLEDELRRSRRYGQQLSLLMLDLDSFKTVNDLYGHPFGDLVLQRCGRILRRAVRESDLACRFGGEEFAVILTETDRLGAGAVAERIRAGLEGSFAERPIGGRVVALTISGGVACYPEDAQDAAVLVSWADQALYRSKLAGRNRITLFHAERRRALRYPVRSQARARLVLRPAGRASSARALNLSSSGVLLESREARKVSEPVEFGFSDAEHGWAETGHVVRVEQVEQGRGLHRMAIAFDRPVAEQRILPHVRRGFRSREATP